MADYSFEHAWTQGQYIKRWRDTLKSLHLAAGKENEHTGYYATVLAKVTNEEGQEDMVTALYEGPYQEEREARAIAEKEAEELRKQGHESAITVKYVRYCDFCDGSVTDVDAYLYTDEGPAHPMPTYDGEEIDHVNFRMEEGLMTMELPIADERGNDLICEVQLPFCPFCGRDLRFEG